MTAPPLPLLVPAPAISFAPPLTVPAFESPSTLSFAAVTFPDGSPMLMADYADAQALVSRTASAASGPEIWDAATKSWLPAAGVDLLQLTGLPLLPPPDNTPGPWIGTLIAVGQKDAVSADQFQIATATGFPYYQVRGLFRAKRGEIEGVGVGPESAPLAFVSAAALKPFAAELTPGPDNANHARILLRSTAGQPLGLIDIDASGGNTVLTLANFDAGGSPLAAIVLQGDGSIVLTPSPGKSVLVSGPLSYISTAAGGAMTPLP